MSEENKRAEEIPQNAPRKNVEDVIKCGPGEASLAIKVRCVVNGPGVEIHLEMATSHTDLSKVPNIPAAYITLAADSIVKEIKERIKPVIVGNESIYHAALRKTDDMFMQFASEAEEAKAKAAEAGETPATPKQNDGEEVPNVAE